MDLQSLPLDQLHVSKLNMRYREPDPDVSDILPSVTARGIYQPLLVRAEGEGFGVVAGRRRLFAARAAREAGADFVDAPCVVMGEGDDAAALEASLLENLARLDPDEVSRWERFSDLIKQGRSIDEIAELFALPPLTVKRILALGALIPAIRKAYREGKIDAPTVRQLTLASKTRQRAWMKRFKGEGDPAPRGRALKAWLFGGDIPTDHALFDLADYKGKIIADLFEERSLFADADAFWDLQTAALVRRRDALREAGWSSVSVLDIGQRFYSWDHAEIAKEEGGAVFIEVRADGEVIEHAGYLTQAEARRLRRGKDGEAGETLTPAKPELIQAAQNYVALHRCAAVRHKLLSRPDLALRLMIAHVIAGSSLWRVEAEPLRATKDATAESVGASKANIAFEMEREAVLELLGWPKNRGSVVHHRGDAYSLAEIFTRLCALDEAAIQRVLAFVMAETLESGTSLVEALGGELGMERVEGWSPDPAFFDLLRDKAAINAMLAEIGGESVAKANLTATAKIQKQIIWDFATGKNRQHAKDWTPRYMRFPVSAYTEAGAGELSQNAARIAGLKTVSASAV